MTGLAASALRARSSYLERERDTDRRKGEAETRWAMEDSELADLQRSNAFTAPLGRRRVRQFCTRDSYDIYHYNLRQGRLQRWSFGEGLTTRLRAFGSVGADVSQRPKW